MILRIETETTFLETMVVIHKRNTVKQPFMTVKKQFLKSKNAKNFIDNEKKITLISQLKEYLTACKPIVRSTNRRRQIHSLALQDLEQLEDLINGRYGAKKAKYIGKWVLTFKNKLQQILPEKMDPIYRVCIKNLNEIINQAQLCAECKRVQQL